MERVVLFICPHGAGKSRMAAAFFNRVAPPGWVATTAGIEPQATVSVHAGRLLGGTDAAGLLDQTVPRPIAAVADPARVVAIDCDVPGTARWALDHQQFDQGMRDELRDRAEALAHEVGRG